MRAALLALACFTLSILAAPAAYAADPAPASDRSTDPIPAYRLGSGDKVRIIIYGEPTLSGEYSISASGTISFPLIGDIAAADHTVQEVQASIVLKLADGYLLKPQVSAEVLTYRPFYILGEVNRPGEYPYSSGLTVLKAVATAGGFTYRANNRRVFIKSGHGVEESAYNLTTMTPVAPGDTIRISERHF